MAKKKATKKKTVQQQVEHIGGYDLDGTLGAAEQFFVRLVEKYGVDARLDWGQHDRYEDAYSFVVLVEREETDEEYLKRTKTEAEQKAWMEERDKKEFERLSKLFGEKK